MEKELDPENKNSVVYKLNSLQESIKSFEELRDQDVLTQTAIIGAGGNEERAMAALIADVKEYGASATETAMQVSLAKNNISSFSELAGKGGDAINKAVENYRNAAAQFGESAEQIDLGAALIANGFDNVEQASKTSGGLEAVFNQFKNNALADGFDLSRIKEFAEALNLIPENKHIEITADGKGLELVENITENQSKNFAVKITADGDVELVNKVTNEMQTLEKLGAVSVRINTESNAFEILNDVGEVVATIDRTTGTVKILKDSSDVDNYQPEDKEATAKYEKESSKPDNYQPENKYASVIYEIKTIGSTNIPTTAALTSKGSLFPAKQQAQGTQNFPGGLAMVNDENIADPREMIADNGKTFIPQGRNVLLELSHGAKVYTAAQTKRIMRNMGIPRYANGKDNSEAFVTARDDWTHYTKTHAVTVTEELEKWLEFSDKFKDNLKDVQDIEEEIYSLTVKQRDEMNDLSEEYISERNYLNDWESYGDNAINAFKRVVQRERQYINDGIITAKTSADYLKQLGKSMYDDRVANSEAWLKHEISYNNLSLDEQREAYERMKQYTQEYYDNAIISYADYITAMSEYSDAQREIIKSRIDESYDWIEKMNFYELWDKMGDNEVDAYGRILGYLKEYLDSGELSWSKYMEYVDDIQRKIYSCCKETYKDITDAMEDAYNERIDWLEKSLDDSLDSIEKYGDKRKEKIKDERNARIEAIQDEIDALEKLKEAEDEASQIKKAQKELTAAKTLLEHSRDADERAELEKEVIRKQTALDELLSEQGIKNKKEQLQAQIKSIEESIEMSYADIDEEVENAKRKARRQYNKEVKAATNEYIKQQYDYTGAIASGEATWAALSNYYNTNNHTVNYNTYSNGGNSLTVNNNGQTITTGQLKLLFKSLFGTY